MTEKLKDCCGNEIIPIRKHLSVHTNRHPNCDGTSWGWIEGCSKNICWSNSNSKFTKKDAEEFVKEWNQRAWLVRKKGSNNTNKKKAKKI